ncbi:NADH--cytochrome b5 reductase 1-like isoform X1 [Fagus crenata]
MTIQSNVFSGFLNPEKSIEFKLVKKTLISPNTAKFTFALPRRTSVLGLPVGQHIICRGKDSQGVDVIRPYTPITLDSNVGYFELVVKGRFKYNPGYARALGMLAGGTGITPMFQLIRAILQNPKDKTNVHLIYANVTLDDILLKEDIDAFARKYPNRLKVYYVLNQPPETWNGGTGFISKEMIQIHCPAPAPDIQILRCAPPPMKKAMAAQLKELGYKREMQFAF